MQAFSEHGLDIDLVLEAVVLGGNTDARDKAAKKKKLRVPQFQETLIRLVAENQVVDHDVLAGRFKRKWSTIRKRNRGTYILEVKRDFFRNIAKLVGRINDSLCAGYRNDDTRAGMLSKTGERFFGLVYNYQTLRVSFVHVDDLDTYLNQIPLSNNGKGKREGPRGSAAEGLGPEVKQPPEPESSSNEILEEQIQTQANERPGELSPCEIRGEGLRVPPESAPSRRPIITDEREHSAPSASLGSAGDEDFATLTDFEEDDVTGGWSFILDNHQVEVQRRIGYVSVDGQPFRAKFLNDLTKPTEICGAVLREIRRFIRLVETQV